MAQSVILAPASIHGGLGDTTDYREGRVRPAGSTVVYPTGGGPPTLLHARGGQYASQPIYVINNDGQRSEISIRPRRGPRSDREVLIARSDAGGVPGRRGRHRRQSF